MAKSPAQEAIERINARVARIGAAPLRMPTDAGFEQQGHGLDKAASAIFASKSKKGGKGGGTRKGDTNFEAQTGQGRLERTLRAAVADITEARDSGDLSAEDADKMLRRAADISENLYNVPDAELPGWVTDEEALKLAVGGADGKAEKSGVDRVLDSTGNVLLEGLRQASRPGQAAMSALAEANRQGEDNPISVGPVKINRGFLAGVEAMFPGITGLDRERMLARGVEGGLLERVDTPGTILNETADIREDKGRGRGYFGSNVRDVSDDWIINNPAVDMGIYTVTDPLSYIGFGTTRAARGALNAADHAIPGVAARLRQGGLEALTEAERATLARELPERAMTALRGAEGGVRVRTPFGKMAEGETAVAGRTIGKPFRAVGESGPVRRLAGTRAADAVAKVGHAVHDAFVPRAALQRALGDQVGRAFDDIRLGLGHTAGQQAQRWVDRAIHVARQVPDLTVDDLKTVGRALDVGGDVDQLPARLRPLADEMGSWRAELTTAQRDAGVLVDPEEIHAARQAKVDAARAKVAGLGDKQAEIQRQIDERLAAAEPVVPDLAPAARRATDAGYAGERADVVLEAGDRLGKAVDQAKARAATAAGRAEAAADRAIEAEASIGRQTARASERSLERGKKAATMPKLNQQLAAVKRDVRAAERDLAAAEEAFERGVVADEDYLPRILTPQAVKVMSAIEDGRLAGQGVTGVRSSVVGDAFVTARKPEWADMSIHEINAEMAGVMDDAVQAGILKPDEALEWFDSNPMTAFAARDATARRHILSKQFYENLGQLRDDAGGQVMRRVDDLPDLPDGFGLVDQPIPVADALRYVDNLPAGTPGARERLARAVTGGDDWVFMDVPALGVGVPPETVLVRREIADELTKVTAAMLDPGPLMRFVDQWQALWKSYATVPLPFGLGFHLRNAQGNVFLNWLAGMNDLGAYVKAAKLQRSAAKGLRRFGDPFHFVRGTADEQLLRDALDNAVIGEGFFDIELGKAGQRTISDTKGRVAVKGTGKSKWRAANPFSRDFALISMGRKLGSSVENNARMAHFLWSMERLGDPLEAARSVRHTLFDYSDVTPFERGVMRRFIPFYTFMRKSAPVVIEGFATQPYKLSRIQQVRMSLAEDADDPQGLYPSFLAEGGAVPLGMSLGGDQLALMPDLPVLSTAENLTDALAVAGALPIVPNVTSRSSTEGAQGLLGLIGGGAPGAASSAFQVATGRRLFGGSELRDKPIDASMPARLLGLARNRDVNGDGTLEPSMTPKSDFLLESLFPIASKVPFGNPAEADKTPRRLISMLTGLKVYPLGESTRDYEGYRRQDALNALLQSWYDQGLLIPGDDTDELERRDELKEAG